jgi:hypothetical protein
MELMTSKCLDLATRDQPVCWKPEIITSVIEQLVPGIHIVEECIIDGVGRFTALANGSVRIVFDDRTCLDMYGLQWEPHVYQRILHNLSDDDVMTYISQVRSSRTLSTHFPDKVCRLLLPNGHYQYVNILQPQQSYERYVRLATEWALWVNTPPSKRHAFYDGGALSEPKQLADIQLMKIGCFSHILDRILDSASTPQYSGTALHSTSPEQPSTEYQLTLQTSSCSSSDSVNAVRDVAEQALQCSAKLLTDLDIYLASVNSPNV